jgi:hypothetical protein
MIPKRLGYSVRSGLNIVEIYNTEKKKSQRQTRPLFSTPFFYVNKRKRKKSMKPLDKERFNVQFVFMLLYLPEIVGNLMTHPTFRASTKGNGQTKRHLR